MQNEPDKSDLVKLRCVELESDLRAFLFGILRDFHEVEDAYQRTVVRAIEASSTVNLDTIKGWLFKIALNEARGAKRSQALATRKKSDFQQLIEISESEEPDAIQQMLSSEQRTFIQEAVARLPDTQQEVIRRRIQQGQKFHQIAKEMDRPLGTILTWMRRALNGLREMQEIRSIDPDLQQHNSSPDTKETH